MAVVLTVVHFSTDSLGSKGILWANDNHNIISKKNVLNEVLSTRKNMGYAGVLPITKVKGKNYVLLSRERFHSPHNDPYHTYCDFGGKVDKGESRGHAACREGHEESSGVYKFNKSDLLKSRIYYNKTLLMAFVEVPYYPKKTFMKAVDR